MTVPAVRPRRMFALINADNVVMCETALCEPCIVARRLGRARIAARLAGDWDGSNDLRQLEHTRGIACLACGTRG